VGFVSATDGTQIFYQDWGSGDPVVFTHSWLLDSNAWEYQFHALVGAGLRCIGLDRRGHVTSAMHRPTVTPLIHGVTRSNGP